MYLKIIIMSLFFLVQVSGYAFCAGPIHGAKAAAMGSAFSAIADDLSAISYNPAGLTSSKGTTVYMGSTAVDLSSTYKGSSGESEDTYGQTFFPPHIYAASDFGKQDMIFGIGVYSPFGIGGRKWNDDGATRYASIENFIGTVWMNPTFAWQVLPTLSIGVGIDYMKAISESKWHANQSMFNQPDAKFDLEADGDGWGYNMGILYKSPRNFNIGLSFRSGIDVDQEGSLTLDNIAPDLQPLFGSSAFKTNVKSTLNFPDIATIAFAVMPTQKIVIDLDLEWIGWSSFKKMELDLETEVPPAGITDRSTNLGWDDVWTIKLGLEYKQNKNLFLRAGYAYVDTPVPENTLGPDNPDAVQHNFSLGCGYVKNKFIIDTFYQVGLFKDNTVNNGILSGDYENSVHYLGISMVYRFH